MHKYAVESGIAITEVRVNNFRSLANVEVELGDLTVLIGSNNAGKTSFLDALFAAVGSGRKALGPDDVRIGAGETSAPRDRAIVIDLRIRAVGPDGMLADKFPAGSYWVELWGASIILDEGDFSESVGIRTRLAWSAIKGDYQAERKFLREWRLFAADWLATPASEKAVTAQQLEPIALHYIDAKRDLDDDLRRQGSFWRRLTEDLGLPEADIAALEETLSGINEQIVDKSAVLKHLKKHLGDLQSVVAADSGGIDIAPVARKLRDLSKGVDLSFSTAGAQSFPLARHGMGTRSLASLLVFRAFASWRNQQAANGGGLVHSILALEEPESHLHPQGQRSLFAHIRQITGQRVVSTHSPYFAGQARLEDLRLLIKRGGETISTKLDLSSLTDDSRRKLQDTVIDSRGDLLFARAVVFFEGQTEEQALPVWATKYWGCSIHELGFSFVRVNGTDYFPFIWLAKALSIPWYVFGDGEPTPVATLEAALKKADQPTIAASANVVVLPNGNNFERQLLAEGYQPEMEAALDEVLGEKPFWDGAGVEPTPKPFLNDYMKTHQGLPRKNKTIRDYAVADGRVQATADAVGGNKLRMARPIAAKIAGLADPNRRFPANIAKLFAILAAEQGVPKKENNAI
ncbi:MAG: AAA family ATPase [Beijerinckiaceae bacterium]|nr:AAA family ATPase [Beijerinckiaceae bacterium]